MTLGEFVRGPREYRGQSPWHVAAAVAFVLAVFAASQVLAALVVRPLTGLGLLELPELQSPEAPAGIAATSAPALMTMLLVAQVVMAGGILLAAARGGRARVLALVPPAGGARAVLYAMLLMAALLGAFNLIAWSLDPAGMARDFRYFGDIARARPAWGVTTLAIGLGAPLSEELVFRGFLLSALAPTRLGYWGAAGLLTAAWAGLHWGYSALGLAEVGLIGLYFSWLVWRTGSLWVPLACHAVYNTALLTVLRLLPAG